MRLFTSGKFFARGWIKFIAPLRLIALKDTTRDAAKLRGACPHHRVAVPADCQPAGAGKTQTFQSSICFILSSPSIEWLLII